MSSATRLSQEQIQREEETDRQKISQLKVSPLIQINLKFKLSVFYLYSGKLSSITQRSWTIGTKSASLSTTFCKSCRLHRTGCSSRWASDADHNNTFGK